MGKVYNIWVGVRVQSLKPIKNPYPWLRVRVFVDMDEGILKYTHGLPVHITIHVWCQQQEENLAVGCA